MYSKPNEQLFPRQVVIQLPIVRIPLLQQVKERTYMDNKYRLQYGTTIVLQYGTTTETPPWNGQY